MAVKLTGTKEAGGAKIGAVTNSTTGEKDGTIPVGDDIIIEGEKIKIQDEAVTLIVRTKYTVGGATLKTVREIRYAYELRAAFQDKTETDRGKRFDINGAKEIFMRGGYFRIEFYKRDGTADAEGTARVFGYCAEHCGDWFTGDFIDENDSA